MKKNKFAILIALILGALSIWFYFKNGSGTIAPSYKNFAIEDITTINKIVLSEGKLRCVIEQKNDGNWLLNNTFPANTLRVKSLLYIFKNIAIKSPVAKHTQDGVIADLLTNGIRCEVFQNNKISRIYYVSKTFIEGGTYMVLVDEESKEVSSMAFVTYIPGVDQNLTPNYLVDENLWREHIIFHYLADEIKTVKVVTPQMPESGFVLTIDEDNLPWVISIGNKNKITNIDTEVIKQYLSYFSLLGFENLETSLSINQLDSIKNTTPLTILTVIDKSGKENSAQFYPSIDTENNIDPNRLLALINGGKDWVVVKYFEYGKVFPPINYFFKK